MKKLNYTFLLLLSFLFVGWGVFTEEANGEELYVQREEIPADVSKVAMTSWREYVESMTAITGQPVENFYVGQPFTIRYPMSKTFVYPIIQRDEQKITYTLQVSYDESESPQLTLNQGIATKLQELSSQIETTREHPIVFYGDQANLFYTQGNESYPLIVVDSTNNPTSPPTSDGPEVVNVLDPTIERTKRAANDIPDDTRPEIEHKLFPNWTAYELQGDEPWCLFVASSVVLNNLAGKKISTAREIVKGIFPKATEQQLKDEKFIASGKLTDSIKYMNNKYNKKIAFKNKTLSFPEVKQEIDQHAPFVINLKAINGASTAHSLVLVGYTAPKNKDYEKNPPMYYYWNPWWKEIFVASSKAPTLKLNAGTYKWTDTLVNFK